jgi:hypothetical protein
MSGKRRITVDEAQWNVLQRQARQLQDLQVNAPKLVADLQRQTQTELARVSERMEHRQRSVEQAMSTLSDQTRDLEAETNRRLRQQASDMQRQLTETAGRLRQDTNAALARQQQAWRAEISAERQRQSAALARVESHIRGKEQASSQAAETWLHDAGVVHDLIRDELPHERFAPGQLTALDRRLATARETASQGQSQAALAGAQAAYHDLSELRVEIELREREWSGQYTVTYEALLRLDGLAKQNAEQVIAAGRAGNDAAITVDVDYWSEGALSELRSTVANLLTRINDTTSPPSTDDLHQITEVQVPELEQRLADITHRAHVRMFASQLRANVAEVVAQTLDETAGYEVEEALYERLDYRRTFMAKLQHVNGNEIVVSVEPATDESGQCVLHVLSYDYDTATEETLSERARVITQELQSQGIPAADQGCDAGEPDPALLDFTPLRQPVLPAVSGRVIPGTVLPADAGH